MHYTVGYIAVGKWSPLQNNFYCSFSKSYNTHAKESSCSYYG